MAILNPNSFYSISASVNISFVDAGLTSSNTRIVYKVAGNLLSWAPGRLINGITGFEAGKGYYIVTGANALDLTGYIDETATDLSVNFILSQDWYLASAMDAPLINLTMLAKETGTYSNLKLADGSAAPSIAVAPEEVDSLGIYDRVEFRYNSNTNTWTKVLIDKREGPPGPAGEGALQTLTNGLTVTGTEGKLGGGLIENTAIDVPATNTLHFNTLIEALAFNTESPSKVVVGKVLPAPVFGVGSSILQAALFRINMPPTIPGSSAVFLAMYLSNQPKPIGYSFNLLGTTTWYPSLHTYSTDIVGFNHRLYTKNLVGGNAYEIRIYDYDNADTTRGESINNVNQLNNLNSIFRILNGSAFVPFSISPLGSITQKGVLSSYIKTDANGTMISGTVGASADTAVAVGASYYQSEVQAILDELRDLKAKMRTAGLLAA